MFQLSKASIRIRHTRIEIFAGCSFHVSQRFPLIKALCGTRVDTCPTGAVGWFYLWHDTITMLHFNTLLINNHDSWKLHSDTTDITENASCKNVDTERISKT